MLLSAALIFKRMKNTVSKRPFTEQKKRKRLSALKATAVSLMKCKDSATVKLQLKEPRQKEITILLD